MLGLQIFYHAAGWKTLVKNGLQPLFLQEPIKGQIGRYYILLSKERGDHIKLLIDTSGANGSDELKNVIKKYLDDFLLAHPSDDKVINYPISSFFKNFDNNSITGCPERITNNFFENDSKSVRFHLSRIIADTLLEEDYQQMEIMLSFIIYTQLLIFKAYFNNLKEVDENFQQTVDHCQQNMLAKNNFFFDGDVETAGLFKNNVDVVLEIINDVWNLTNTNNTTWMIEWENCCKAYIHKSGSFFESFSIISALIYEHLGFKSKNLMLETLQLLRAPISIAAGSGD